MNAASAVPKPGSLITPRRLHLKPQVRYSGLTHIHLHLHLWDFGLPQPYQHPERPAGHQTHRSPHRSKKSWRLLVKKNCLHLHRVSLYLQRAKHRLQAFKEQVSQVSMHDGHTGCSPHLPHWYNSSVSLYKLGSSSQISHRRPYPRS